MIEKPEFVFELRFYKKKGLYRIMKNLLRGLKKFDDTVYAGQKVLILIAVVIMLAVNGAQVFCRYVVHSSLPWSEQLSLLMYLVLVMLGANLAVKSESETKIDIIMPKDPKHAAALKVVCDILSVIAVVAFLKSAIALVIHTSQFPNIYSSLKISYNFCYVWLVIGFILILIDKIINLIKNICILKGEDITDLYPPEVKEVTD